MDADDSPAPPRRRRKGKRVLMFLLFAAIAGGIIAFERHRRQSQLHAEWAKKQPGLPPSGGKEFDTRVVIDVPAFLQGDPLWGSNRLGPSTTNTLASHGCAVASCAMVLASYGVDTDPQRLNDFLQLHNGFTPQAWLKWEVAAQLSPDRVRFVYEDDPSYKLIDDNLERGNPVIIRLRYPPPVSITHFVVICGKEGYDYLIMDPGSRGSRGIYPLKEIGSNIEALRYYERVQR
jgi:hypothetical protein